MRPVFERLTARSIAVIEAGQTASGAYLACPNFPPYQYCWFRDGAFTAEAMSRIGREGSASRFFDWGASVILERREQIEHGARPHARYTPDGRESEEEWSDFQLDGYGLFLWALKGHELRHGPGPAEWYDAAGFLAEWLAGVWREPCYDWWEERWGVHPTTLACLAGGLAAWGHREADEIRSELTGLRSIRLDASLLVLGTPFDLLEPGSAVLGQIEQQLVSPGGGVHRHLDDTYYGGGEWLLLTALLGWHYAELGRIDDALGKLEWVAAQADADGNLPEQSDSQLLAPEMLSSWVEKWGPPASPLLWSHAMFLILAHRLNFA